MSFTIKARAMGLLAVGSAAVALAAVAPAAGADTVSTPASGYTNIQLNSQTVKTLQSNGCGTLSAVATGDGTVASNSRSKINMKFPVTDYVINPGTDNMRIEHSGSGVELSNDCYDIRLTNLYVQNFGKADESQTLDVSALARQPGGSATRETDFTADLNGANITGKDGKNTKIRSLDLLLTQDGANEFNEIATSNEPDEGGNVAGPFSDGMQVGQARTFVRFQGAVPSA